MSFGSRLRELRTAVGMTQAQLAKEINLSKANVSKYEADIVQPNLNTLAAISLLFNVSVDYLLDIQPTSNNTSINMPMMEEYLPIIKFIASLPKSEQSQAKAHFTAYIQLSKAQRKEIDSFTEYIRSKK